MVTLATASSVLARNASYARHGVLSSGSAVSVPPGVWQLRLGPLLSLTSWDSQRLRWRTELASPTGHYTVNSDGSNYRIVNTTNCARGVTNISPGSGYSSANPPVLSTTRTPQGGQNKPTFRTYVGGACTVVVDTPGLYHLQPSAFCDVSQQTPPFVTPQFEVRLNGSGQVVALYQTGNDTGFPSYSGAGLDVSKLTIQIIPHPDDTGVTEATVHPVAAGAGVVTQVDLLTFGGPIGNFDFVGTSSITHNGGTGFNATIIGDFLVSGYTINSGGQYGSQDSSVLGDYPIVRCVGGMLDDEFGTAREASAECILTGGVISQANLIQNGGKYQWRPRAVVAPHLAVPTVNAKLTPILNVGNDQWDGQRVA